MIESERLLLIPATAERCRAELKSRAALAEALAADVPPSWPPEYYDEEAVRYALAWILAHPAELGWGFYYIVRRSGDPLLIGAAGFKGGPDASGRVEIGYGIVSEHQRRGYATEAVEGLLRFAFASPAVRLVIGQTLPSLRSSIGVLEKAGFRFVGEGEDPHAPPGERVVRYELDRAAFTAAGG